MHLVPHTHLKMIRRLGQTSQIRASSLVFGRPLALATPISLALRRSIATDRITGDREQEILVQQRKNRPMSPHLEIYQPQLTWYLSGLHRITGVALAFAFYGGLVSYAGLPMLGLPFTVTDVATYWSSMPYLLKACIKAGITFPFAFHSWNGLRHLVWDTGRELTLKGVYRTGYAVLGLAAISSVGLAFL